jgi:hypothetical protein
MILHKRTDGSFVIEKDGNPYHVTLDDPLFAEVAAAAEGMDLEPDLPIVAPSFPKPVPTITRRQCARELFKREMITGPEMVAMTATGTPPAMIEQVFAAMPEVAQFEARADFAAGTYERDNPLLVSVLESSGRSSAEIDDFFNKAAQPARASSG